jgi:opacity protein-like surface antigen
MLRRTAVLGAGIIMAATVAWTGAVASATQPTSRITAGSKWTVVFKGGGCEVQTFGSHGTWTADRFKDAGTYGVDGSTLDEQWTKGVDKGLSFDALYNKARKDYKGQFGGISAGSGKLVMGAKSSC